MKRFIVIRVYSCVCPSVIFSSDDVNDANDYARIMSKTDERPHMVVDTLFGDIYNGGLRNE